jgi:hypothetical protein
VTLASMDNFVATTRDDAHVTSFIRANDSNDHGELPRAIK